MNYFLLKLAFDTAVHFGGSDSAVGAASSSLFLHADTIFSALCHTALETGGSARLAALCEAVQHGTLRFSNAMPWRQQQENAASRPQEVLYLPKPLAVSAFNESISTMNRKAIKKLAWIPVSKFDAYTASLHQGAYPLDKLDSSFGEAYQQAKACVTEGADALPYSVGLYAFHPGCGLYMICACADDALQAPLVSLFHLLGRSGIGGRTSSGYGRFHLEGDPICLNDSPDPQHQWMLRALESTAAPYLLLTSSLPANEELDTALEGAAFQVVRRAGFAFTEQADTPQKKQTQYFLAAGSVLQHRYQGALYDVGLGLPHPVYRYSKPLFMGVTL